MSKPIFRFAPSPNGELHLGHAYSALYTWAAANKAGGTVLLRIEDIDIGRCRPHFTEQIFTDLKWLGLSWPKPVRIQSEHFDDYETAARTLERAGLTYRCFCTRKQIQTTANDKRDPDGALSYPGTCKHLSDEQVAEKLADGTPFAIRLDMSKAIKFAPPQAGQFSNLADWGDIVLVRKDTPTSYHLSVVIDDALQGVTHVTRGMDMFAATSVHMILQNLLRLPTPDYDHHKLINDDAGQKLAKTINSRSLRALRESGVAPGQIKKMLRL